MKAIAVIAKNNAIGKDGGLLFRLPSDLMHFREHTLGKTCIMGRKTLESMPKGKPLPGRHTVVISRSMTPGVFYENDGFMGIAVGSKEDAIKAVEQYGLTEPVICGGAQIYALFLDDCDTLVLTEVEEEAKDADAYFPEFKQSGRFKVTEETGPFTENGHSYYIREYQKNR